MDVDAIVAYEALFFNVRDRLHAKSYIFHQVLGRAISTGVKERQYDLIWKVFGYKYGPLVVDALVESLEDLQRPQSASEVRATLEDALRSCLLRKAITAVYTLDASNGWTQNEIISNYQKMRELESGKDGGRGAAATMLSNVEVMMNCVPFAVGNKPPENRRVMSVPTLALADKRAAEPRGDELLMLAAGRRPDGADQIESLVFPALPAPARQAPVEPQP